MGQQWLQFVLLLTAIHRIRLVALHRETPSAIRDQARVVQGIARTSDWLELGFSYTDTDTHTHFPLSWVELCTYLKLGFLVRILELAAFCRTVRRLVPHSAWCLKWLFSLLFSSSVSHRDLFSPLLFSLWIVLPNLETWCPQWRNDLFCSHKWKS